MALDNVTSHFSTMLEPIASASFLSSLSIIHAARKLMLIETFRFEDENDYEYEIWFKVFSLIVKK